MISVASLAAVRSAADSSRNSVVGCDAAGRILFVNSPIEAMFGYAASELVGRSIGTLVPDQDGFAGTTIASWAGRSLRGRHKNGTLVPIGADLTASHADGSPLILISFTDLTARSVEVQQPDSSERDSQVFLRHLTLDQVLTELTAKFVTLPPADVDDAIVESQRQIGEALEVDRVSLWELSADGLARCTHSWTRTGFPGSPDEAPVKVGPSEIEPLTRGEALAFTRLDEISNSAERERLTHTATKSLALLPVALDGHLIGVLSFATLGAERDWPRQTLDRLRLVASVFAAALRRRDDDLRLHHALAEVKQLRDQSVLENTQLRSEVKALRVPRAIVAESPAARRALAHIAPVAATNATVLLLGETGSGKEVFAQAIHDLSPRHRRPMVRVNLGAIPSALVESELFGRERGAYTGALSRQIGRFEIADGSTVFLDEIGELPLETQVKLLRVLQDKIIERLGSNQTIKTDVRIIAATNRDLEQAVKDRTFREDLYYRLNVYPIVVPPLRERQEDIPILVWTFVDEFASAFGKRIESISKESLAALQRYSWPGNVRELRNLVERAMIVATGPRLVLDPPRPVQSAETLLSTSESSTLTDVETKHIRSVLEVANWRVRGKGGAAERLGIKPTTLESRMARLGIRRADR